MIRKAIVLLSALLVAAQGITSAQTTTTDKKMTSEKANVLVQRPSMRPVKSLTGEKSVMDTLETSNPAVMIILYDDNTWEYWKDPSSLNSTITFTEYWDTERAIPYPTSLTDMPESVTIWLVDSDQKWCVPYQTKVYSPFGYRHRRRHQGVDLPLHTGDPVHAAFDGKVRLAKYYTGYGNLVIIRHENGLETFYGHLSKIKVKPGDWVKAGDVIALGGSTGRSTGPHLHFETRYRGFAFDPQRIADYETGTLRHMAFVLKKKYLDANSKYVPTDDNEDWEIAAADSTEIAEKTAAAAAAKAAEAAKQYYTIRSGDTLGRIAIKYHTTVKKLCALNGIKETTTLSIGRRIRVK